MATELSTGTDSARVGDQVLNNPQADATNRLLDEIQEIRQSAGNSGTPSGADASTQASGVGDTNREADAMLSGFELLDLSEQSTFPQDENQAASATTNDAVQPASGTTSDANQPEEEQGWWGWVKENSVDAATSVADGTMAAASYVGTKTMNAANVGEQLAVGAYESGREAVEGIGEGINAAADWAYEHPAEAAALAAAGVAAGVIIVGTGGTGAAIALPMLELAGTALVAHSVVSAAENVYANGELDVLMNRENHTPEEVAEAERQLREDTGGAVLASSLMGAGAVIGSFASSAAAGERIGVAATEAGGGSAEAISVGQMSVLGVSDDVAKIAGNADDVALSVAGTGDDAVNALAGTTDDALNVAAGNSDDAANAIAGTADDATSSGSNVRENVVTAAESGNSTVEWLHTAGETGAHHFSAVAEGDHSIPERGGESEFVHSNI